MALDNYSNLAKAFGLSASKKKPPRSTVDRYISKGQEPEQAFGLTDRPWKKALENIYKLINDKGYKLFGELTGIGKPVVDHPKKEIYSTAKKFAEEYNYDYTTVSDQLKSYKPEEIRKKHND